MFLLKKYPMKLTNEIKQKIDNFFDNISAEELYNISVQEYGFKEVAKESRIDLSSLISKSDKQILQSSDLVNVKYNGKRDDIASSSLPKVECKSVESDEYSGNYSNNDPITPLAA